MTEKEQNFKNLFTDYIENHHVIQAILQGIPFIGPSIKEFMFGNTLPRLINEFSEKSQNQQDLIISYLEQQINDVSSPPQHTVVIGSGNCENIIQLERPLEHGEQTITKYKKIVGGSGVNTALRLMNASLPVLPILSIGNDERGQRIQDWFKFVAMHTESPRQTRVFIESDAFFIPNYETPVSTIIVHKDERTIISEERSFPSKYQKIVKDRISGILSKYEIQIEAIYLGHIYGDHIYGKEQGEISKWIINSFSKNYPIFTNFGISQYSLGADFWEEELCKVKIFQLNLSEMKTFCYPVNHTIELYDILKYFQTRNVTAIITLGTFGAVGTLSGYDNVTIAYPFKIDDFVDSTGAGDAFMAGLIYMNSRQKEFTPGTFSDAIREARLWSAFACTKLGGSIKLEHRDGYDGFKEQINESTPDLITQPIESQKNILDIMDRAYSDKATIT